MAYPVGVSLITVSSGSSIEMETGTELITTISVSASRDDLVWSATGQRFPNTLRSVQSGVGASISMSIPATDLVGWEIGGEDVDVSGGKQSHTYNFVLNAYKTVDGKLVLVKEWTLDNVVLPQAVPFVDLDTIQVSNVTTEEGITVPYPLDGITDDSIANLIDDELSSSYAALTNGFVPWQVITHPRWGADKSGDADSTDAILACATYLMANGGGTLIAPPGTYQYDAFILPQGDGLTILGDGRGTTVFKLSPAKLWNTTASIATSTVGAPLRNTKNLRIEHIVFDGNAAARTEPPRWLQTPAGAAIVNPQVDYFANGGKINDPAHAADDDAVALSQALAAAGNLVLTANPYTPNSVRKITITSAGNDSARQFTITGTDFNNSPLVATVTGTNAGVATTSVVFKTVTQVAVNGAVATTVKVGIAAFDIFGVVAEGRRNPNYTKTFSILSLYLVENGTVQNCKFINHKGFGIIEGGGRDIDIKNNYFENVGKNDGPYMCIWTQSYGTPGGGDPWYQDSENINVSHNTGRNLERGFCLFAPTKGGKLLYNYVDTCGEFGMFMPTNLHFNGGRSEIAYNTIKHVRVTDIAASGFEFEHPSDTNVHHNDIEDTDQYGMILTGARRSDVHKNTLTNCYTTHTLPYGPFSERYGFNVGLAPIAGTVNAIADGAYFSIGTLDGIGCNKLLIERNRIYENRVAFPSVFKQNKSGGNSLAGDCLIEENILDVPAAMQFLNKSVLLVWAANGPLAIRHNIGHVSEAPVIISHQVAAGATGALTFTPGFRPRLVRVYASANNATLGQECKGEFAWRRDAVGNAFSQRSASVSGTGQQVAIDAAVQVAKLTDAAGVITFNVGFTAWTEDGFIINVSTVTNITNLRFVCEP